jgi:hypothetical protein
MTDFDEFNIQLDTNQNDDSDSTPKDKIIKL